MAEKQHMPVICSGSRISQTREMNKTLLLSSGATMFQGLFCKTKPDSLEEITVFFGQFSPEGVGVLENWVTMGEVPCKLCKISFQIYQTSGTLSPCLRPK